MYSTNDKTFTQADYDRLASELESLRMDDEIYGQTDERKKKEKAILKYLGTDPAASDAN